MPISEAYNRFLDSLSMAESLLNIERDNYNTPPRTDEQSAVRGLRGGAAVLMVASFEYYLRELIIEMLDAISGPVNGIDFAELPDVMRVTSVFESLNLSMKGPRHHSAPPKVDRIASIETSCKHILAGNLHLEAFTDTGSNPCSKVVNALFKNLGMPSVLTKVKAKFQARSRWGSAVSDTFIADKLDEIVGHRNVVAHTAKTLDLTRTQLRTSVKFLRVLGEVLEITLKAHIDSMRDRASSALP